MMRNQRVSLGFDVRTSVDLCSTPIDQRLDVELSSPISADPGVWIQPKEVENLMQGALSEADFRNPLYLARSIELLRDAAGKRDLSANTLSSVCITSCESNLIALAARFGSSYFDNQPREEQLLSFGWALLGFDIVDLNGMISGLKGCGFAEPTRSQLHHRFANGLNRLGLFTDPQVASQFAEVRGLQIREHAPFVVVGVLTQE
jgi:hypothetical protein